MGKIIGISILAVIAIFVTFRVVNCNEYERKEREEATLAKKKPVWTTYEENQKEEQKAMFGNTDGGVAKATIDGGTKQEEAKMGAPQKKAGVVTSVPAQPGQTGFTVYLTFDGVDEEIVDFLSDQGIPATYFVTVEETDGGEDLFRKVLGGGHGIGLMSGNQKRLTDEVNAGLVGSSLYNTRMEKPLKLVSRIAKQEIRMFRAPPGADFRDHQLDDLDRLYHVKIIGCSVRVDGEEVVKAAGQKLRYVNYGDVICLPIRGVAETAKPLQFLKHLVSLVKAHNVQNAASQINFGRLPEALGIAPAAGTVRRKTITVEVPDEDSPPSAPGATPSPSLPVFPPPPPTPSAPPASPAPPTPPVDGGAAQDDFEAFMEFMKSRRPSSP